MEDKVYCMSSYLMLRTIYNHNIRFRDDITPSFFEENSDRNIVNNSSDLEKVLKKSVADACRNKKAAICLSGGIDSAILARFMPKGSLAYTFKCVVPGIEVTDETKQASAYAKECGLIHKVVEVYWSDFEKYSSLLMKNKGAPLHSIEIQIYKAALQAIKDGVDILVFGESADVNFGGQDGLFAKDWTTDEYLERYAYLMPDRVLKKYVIIREPFEKYSKEGMMNVHEFNRHVYYVESVGSYMNACKSAGIELCLPFSKTYLGVPLDVDRIRNGQNKYIVRELFNKLYPSYIVPKKIPMPRPMNEWMKDYSGPLSSYFRDDLDVTAFTGDQKWQLWCLDKFIKDFNL